MSTSIDTARTKETMEDESFEMHDKDKCNESEICRKVIHIKLYFNEHVPN